MILNKIYNEPCIHTMSKMKDGFIDLTVTSPPYDNLRTYKDDIDKTWCEDIWKPIINELFRVTKDGGVVVWVVGDATINGSETGGSFRQALWAKDCGFHLHDTMIYNRTSAFPSNVRYSQNFEYMFIFSKGKPITVNLLKEDKWKKSKRSIALSNYTQRTKCGSLKRNSDNGMKRINDAMISDKKIMSNVWYIPSGNMVSTKDRKAYDHPAIFPEKLARDHIYSWSNENDLIYDPFMGSGTTAKMAHLQNRKWIGSEISAEYVEIANKRLKPYLDQIRMF